MVSRWWFTVEALASGAAVAGGVPVPGVCGVPAAVPRGRSLLGHPCAPLGCTAVAPVLVRGLECVEVHSGEEKKPWGKTQPHNRTKQPQTRVCCSEIDCELHLFMYFEQLNYWVQWSRCKSWSTTAAKRVWWHLRVFFGFFLVMVLMVVLIDPFSKSLWY